jgi:ribosomal protein L37AE/L43A
MDKVERPVKTDKVECSECGGGPLEKCGEDDPDGGVWYCPDCGYMSLE